MAEPETLLFEASPHGNLEAWVDQDDATAVLYLMAPENPSFGLKSCWIRNLAAAPENLDVARMREGVAPMMPAVHCAYPGGQPPLTAGSLRLVWFPEGDGVALLEGEEMLAAIPGWGGMNDFHGYARDAVGQGPIAWKLEEPAHFDERIKQAERFWEPWISDAANTWQQHQKMMLGLYERGLGQHAKYYAIDGGNWPPSAIVRYDQGSLKHFLTLGVSLRPQPAVETYVEDPSPLRRIELAFGVDASVSDETVSALLSYVSGQATLPWMHITWLGNGHTIPCSAFAEDRVLKNFSAILLTSSPLDAPLNLEAHVDGDPINLLWMIPITAEEKDYAMENSSAGLMAKFPGGAPSCVIGPRKPVTKQGLLGRLIKRSS